MSEINNKYKIGVRRFNINWIGIKSLVLNETTFEISTFEPLLKMATFIF